MPILLVDIHNKEILIVEIHDKGILIVEQQLAGLLASIGWLACGIFKVSLMFEVFVVFGMNIKVFANIGKVCCKLS